MTNRRAIPLGSGRLLALCLSALFPMGCRCAGAPGPQAEASVPERAHFEIWGARFSLPDGWAGGENDAGGWELTDGHAALMAGRKLLEPSASLESLMADRRAALEAEGPMLGATQSETRFGSSRGLLLSGRLGGDGGSVEVRLLVVRLNHAEALSLLVVGDSAEVGAVDEAWSALLGSLEIPAK